MVMSCMNFLPLSYQASFRGREVRNKNESQLSTSSLGEALSMFNSASVGPQKRGAVLEL